MSAVVTYPHIVKEDGKPARLEKNPRWRISMLIRMQRAFGFATEEMPQQYPDLSLSEVYSGLAYYHDHKEEIDREIAEEDVEFKRGWQNQEMTPVLRRLQAIKASGGFGSKDAG